MVTLIARSAWGARYPDGFADRALPATEAWLHHTVTIAPDLVPPFTDDDAAIRLLESIGQQRFGGGMSYTRLFTPIGRGYVGHSIDRRGAHTGGHNTVGVGYALVGNYDEDRPTEAMLEAVAQALVQDHRAGYLARPALNGGHRDTKSTSCPGRFAYAAIAGINARAAAIMRGEGQTPPPPPPPPPPGGLVVDGDLGPKTITRWQQVMRTPVDGVISSPRSALIVAVQRHLNARGHRLVVDGDMGPKTIGALQRYLGTPVDGVISRPRSTMVMALQRRLNTGRF